MNRIFILLTVITVSLLALGCVQQAQPTPAPTIAPTAAPLGTPTPGPAAATATPGTQAATPTAEVTATPTAAPTPAPATLDSLAENARVAAELALNRTFAMEKKAEAYGGYQRDVFIGGLRDSFYDFSLRVVPASTLWSSTDMSYVQARSGFTTQKREVYWEKSSTFDQQSNKIKMYCYGNKLVIEANINLFLPAGVDPSASEQLMRALVDVCPDA